ncbi:MAG TPA: ATP-binding cassette domain-containing protein, partial [Patescibacteria group bacterium]|nr:ATP-binding cassette domain-containing protein [Patescibacteria group bacterium]
MESHSTDNGITPSQLLKLVNINFSLDNIRVLKDINFDVHRSEFHALVGDHGSGKSSLAMIIAGMHKPSTGEILFKDKSYSFLNLRKARKLSIEMVCQDIQLIDYFTVAENLLIPDKVYRLFPLIKRKLF